MASDSELTPSLNLVNPRAVHSFTRTFDHTNIRMVGGVDAHC